jgi:hypothetical protein
MSTTMGIRIFVLVIYTKKKSSTGSEERRKKLKIEKNGWQSSQCPTDSSVIIQKSKFGTFNSVQLKNEKGTFLKFPGSM